jgi:hypothetical protein
MKITITPDGEIQMDTNGSTPAEIAGTVLSIQQELRKKAKNEPCPPSLNDKSGQLYDWLVANDNENGVHFSAAARHFEISNGAARHRLITLVKLGFAVQVTGHGRGLYRAVVA